MGRSKRNIKSKSIYDQFENVSTKSENISEIKILGINQEEVTVPKMDGTRGSGLYSIPFLLNQCPSREWCEIL